MPNRSFVSSRGIRGRLHPLAATFVAMVTVGPLCGTLPLPSPPDARRGPAALGGSRAVAQDEFDEGGDGAAPERLPSYELALHGTTHAVLGDALRFEGVAYEVRGLADLVPLGSGGEVVARLTQSDPRTGRAQTVAEQRVTPGTGGRFTLKLQVPDAALASPALEVAVGRRGGLSRSWTWNVSTSSSLRVELLTDRALYEPGETARLWARVVRVSDGAPVAGREVALTVTDANSQRAAERRMRTSPGGVVTLEVPLGAAAPEGAWQVSAAVVGDPGGVSASRGFRVGRRTVERLLAKLDLDRELVSPGEELRGQVSVRTPSGAPVRGAHVVVRIDGREEPVTAESDADGVAAFRATAPAFLSGDSARMSVRATVTHPAHGSIGVVGTYTLARVAWLVSAEPAAGALVPEVDTELYVAVASPLGRPPPVGTRVTASGPAVRGGRATATTDAAGLVVVPMRLPPSAVAPLTRGGTGCDRKHATLVDVVVDAERPVSTRMCVRAAPEAEVLPRVRSAVVAPGGEVAFEVHRRPRVVGRPVLVEVQSGRRTVASTWVAGGESRGAVTLPAGVTGVLEVRARAAASENARAADDEPWPVAVGAGARDAVLVRPADAFALAVETPAEALPVRSRGRVTLRTTRIAGSAASTGGFAAVLARDLAAHGGETPWALEWMQGLLGEAAKAPHTPDGDRALRAALAAGLEPDDLPARPAPLRPRPGDENRYGYADPAVRGVLRDPVALRGELLRHRLGEVMVALENFVEDLRDAEDRREAERGVVVRTGSRLAFDPRAVATLVARGELDDESTRTLGGARITVAMLQQADPSFSFDAAARRVARRQLVELLAALAAFTNPDDPSAARALAGEPPERWLGKMARLGLVSNAQLRDPWGRPFAFRRVAGASAGRLLLTERAPDHELASAGPDGVFGNADDVRDPFARVVPKGTLYARASGEDRLMEELSAIGAGDTVLARMANAYERLALEAREESRRGALHAMESEDVLAGETSESAMYESGGYGESIGYGGGIGVGSMSVVGRGAGVLGRSTHAEGIGAAPAVTQEESRVREDQRDAAGRASVGGSSRLQVMGELIRERFPATLFFAGEVTLDPSGATTLEVPVADALTSYVVEAIAWTGSGWTTSAAGTLRVDQEASVDAPVPTFATAGDVLRLPVRVGNRTAAPLEVRVEVSAEGGLALEAPGPRTLTVPPRDVREAVVEVRTPREGSGAVVVRCVRASDGSALDAVQRPLVVWRDARPERRAIQTLMNGDATLVLTLPPDASPRGHAELRASAGSDLFGNISAWARETGAIGAGWALATAGSDVPAPARARADALLGSGSDGLRRPRGDAPVVAMAMGVAWNGETTSDERLRAALRYLGDALRLDDPTRTARAPAATRERIAPPRPPPRPSDGGATSEAAWVLLGLSPALARADARRAVKADLERIANALQRRVEDGGAAVSDRPALSALCAAALAVSGRGRPARVEELLRRAERGVVRVGDAAFLDADDAAPVARTRVVPTASLALAHLWRDEVDAALPAFRGLAGLRGTQAGWNDEARALAALVALRISGGRGSAALRLRVDGRDAPLRVEDGTAVAALAGLGTPGVHRVELTGARRTLTLVTLDVPFGRPWTSPVERAAPLGLAIEGPVGVRDRRAGLRVSVQNRGARVVAAPVLEVDLPAGAELDEPTRARLRELTADAPALEGRTLRLRLRALMPGAYVRIPLPVRWATGGRLRGLGVVAYDAAEPPSLDPRAVAVVPSREVVVADEGPETPEPPAESSPPPPQPPPPPPMPIPLRPRASRTLAGVAPLPRPRAPSTGVAARPDVVAAKLGFLAEVAEGLTHAEVRR
jgi:hypothetical protein